MLHSHSIIVALLTRLLDVSLGALFCVVEDKQLTHSRPVATGGRELTGGNCFYLFGHLNENINSAEKTNASLCGQHATTRATLYGGGDASPLCTFSEEVTQKCGEWKRYFEDATLREKCDNYMEA